MTFGKCQFFPHARRCQFLWNTCAEALERVRAICNTTRVHISSWIEASHFMILWMQMLWNTLASLPMKLFWTRTSEKRTRSKLKRRCPLNLPLTYDWYISNSVDEPHLEDRICDTLDDSGYLTSQFSVNRVQNGDHSLHGEKLVP